MKSLAQAEQDIFSARPRDFVDLCLSFSSGSWVWRYAWVPTEMMKGLLVTLSCILAIQGVFSQFQSFRVAGTHYDIGHQIGTQFGANIQKFLDGYDALKGLEAFYNTNNGRRIFDTFVAVNAAAFPQYFDEIRGLADGANLFTS